MKVYRANVNFPQKDCELYEYFTNKKTLKKFCNKWKKCSGVKSITVYEFASWYSPANTIWSYYES